MTARGTHAVVVLAAGAATRFGSPKQLLRLGDGRAMLRAAVDAAAGTRPARVVVVLGANRERVAPVLDGLGVDVAWNPDWAAGPGGSVRAGVAAARAAAPGLSGVLVHAADLPGVDAAALRPLVRGPGEVAAAAFSGTLGVPAWFGADRLGLLEGLPDARGAGAALRLLPGVRAVPLPAAADDVDTPADAERLTRGASGPASR